MPSAESGSEYFANESSGSISETTLSNLKALREGMVNKYKDYAEKYMQCEIKEYMKYSFISDLKETYTFQDDSEDLGIKEDLELLDIK